jgi:hypothetical protein
MHIFLIYILQFIYIYFITYTNIMNGTQGTEGTTGNQVPFTPQRQTNQPQTCIPAEVEYDNAKAAKKENNRLSPGTTRINLFPKVPKDSTN